MRQTSCDKQARYRVTWPGSNERLICEKHKQWLEAIAKAMGFYLQIIPLSEEDSEYGLNCGMKQESQLRG